MTLTQVLNTHGIQMKECCGRLLALEVFTINGIPGEEWLDVTDWSMTAVKHWLGY